MKHQMGVADDPRPPTPTREDRGKPTDQVVRISTTEPRGKVGGSHPASEARGGCGKRRKKSGRDPSGATKVGRSINILSFVLVWSLSVRCLQYSSPSVSTMQQK